MGAMTRRAGLAWFWGGGGVGAGRGHPGGTMGAMTRRASLSGFAAAGMAATGAMAKSPTEPFFKANRLPIGLQLYTLGGDLRADVDGMLGQVAKIGYRTVELAGYLGKTPQELKASFDKAGLKATSSHVQAE